ncbi:TRAP transporter substrate-binding protein [Petroclostridium xylanilyticum]|jgi:tripartite ATP-independent transporter DctP family solute receptor|uniref:TRAP transporter substrate-binding protein n=1 Tax=Petroclostridium xylanilyticum TaxID=1792311 RepID=UPI000B987D94|nr:TRAP transporter substrate-binding protein [Petroclostridium xylanilyticum]
MKKIVGILLVLSMLCLSLAGCGASTTSNKQVSDKPTGKEQETTKTYKIKVANILAADHPETLAFNKFKELVETKSEGKIKVEVYPNCQLGSSETYIDSMRQGAIEITSPGTVMAQLQPLVATPEMPLLFRDWDHVKKTLTGPLAEEMTKGMVEKLGVRHLGFAPISFRVITSNFEIKKFEDLKGMRLRVPNIPFYIEFAKGVGANPIAMAFSELFTGLEQKVVDGQENPYATIKANKFYEVQPYILDSRHIFTVHGWYINEKFYQSLPEKYQKIVADSAKEAIEYCYEISIKAEEEAIQFLKDKGIKIHFPDETFKEKLKESQKDVREFFYKQYPGSKELAEKIEKVQ